MAYLFGKRAMACSSHAQADSALCWMFLAIAGFATFFAVRQGYWQFYYVAIAGGALELATLILKYQVQAAWASGLASFFHLAHMRPYFEPKVGRWWVVLLLMFAALLFVIGAYAHTIVDWVYLSFS